MYDAGVHPIPVSDGESSFLSTPVMLFSTFPRGRDIFSLYNKSTDTLRWARWSGVFLFITWCLLLVGCVQAVSTGIVHQASLEWNDHMLKYRFLGPRPT